MKSTKSKHYYSPIQYFFWLFSGCEINVLKECPTDFNRQAGIGFTIFMTTLFAFAAGSYAGFYFSHNIISALGFGLIWSLLVFSIDRAMVVTMKKDPTLKSQPFWIPLISRGLLALLIAFVISIPLELLIFRDKIEEQKQIDEVDKVNEHRNDWLVARGVNEDKANKNEAEKDAEIALANANDCRRDPKYRELDNQLPALKKKMERTPPTVSSIYGPKPNIAYKIARSNYYLKLRERNKRGSEFQNEQKIIYNENISKIEKISIKIDSNIQYADQKATDLQNALKNSFIRDFEALENAAHYKKIIYDTVYSSKIDKSKNESLKQIDKISSKYEYKNLSILFFLWLIRILFFLIELLPTISKIVTPVGAYDIAIYRREKDFEKELEEGSDAYLEHQKNMQELENKAELELKMEILKLEKEMKIDILKEASEAQNLVARKKIEEFKNKNL
jgi:hypothetical protein